MNRVIVFFILIASITAQVFGYSILSLSGPSGIPFTPVSGQSRGMGGTSIALESPANLSLVNPAGISFARAASFSIEYIQEYTKIYDADGNESIRPDHYIPMAVFVYPISTFGNLFMAYHLNSRLDLDFVFESDLEPASVQRMIFTGSRYSGKIGFSRSWFRKLHTGLSLHASNGMENRMEMVDYSNTTEIAYADRKDSTLFYTKEYGIDFGLTFPTRIFSIGASVQYPLWNSLVRKKSVGVADIVRSEQDTLEEVLPFTFGCGVSLKAVPKVLIAMDFLTTGWSAYSRDGYTESLDNDMKVAMGFEWAYNRNSEYSWIARVPIRSGLFYKKWANDGIKEAGLTLGTGLPFARNSGIMDISFSFSKRGDIGTNKLEENCYQISVGVTGGSHWKSARRK